MNPPPSFFHLSNASLTKGSQLSERFIELGCQDFHDACKWLHKLPYGKNTRPNDLGVLFEDQQGTCTSKHGVAAALAAELALPVFKYIVFYRLDETVIQNSKPILSSFDLEYVPAIHCLLGEAGQFVDLTWDNQTGKLKNLNDFELYLKSVPMLTHDEHKAVREWGIKTYQQNNPKLAELDCAKIAEIASAIFRSRKPCNC